MIYYCPKCKKLTIGYKKDRDTISFTNIRDGYGRPLHHAKCECGNYLAAYMDFNEKDTRIEPELINYIKSIIEGYNVEGCYYNDGFYEFVKENIIKQEQGLKIAKEERQRVLNMSEEERYDYFVKKYPQLYDKN